MKNDNKEMQLLAGLGKMMVKYMDYFALLFIFPVIFDVRIFDPKVFIALGSLIVIKAIMPIAQDFAGVNEKIQPAVQPAVQAQPVVVQVKAKEEQHPIIEEHQTIYSAEIDTEQFQKSAIKFDKITTKKTDVDFMLLSFPDFRTLKLHKSEVQQACTALLESEYNYFKPGKWKIEIKAKQNL